MFHFHPLFFPLKKFSLSLLLSLFFFPPGNFFFGHFCPRNLRDGWTKRSISPWILIKYKEEKFLGENGKKLFYGRKRSVCAMQNWVLNSLIKQRSKKKKKKLWLLWSFLTDPLKSEMSLCRSEPRRLWGKIINRFAFLRAQHESQKKRVSGILEICLIKAFLFPLLCERKIDNFLPWESSYVLSWGMRWYNDFQPKKRGSDGLKIKRDGSLIPWMLFQL